MWKSVATHDAQELYYWMLQSKLHIVTMREIHVRIRFGWRCVERIVTHDRRQSIVSKYDTHTLELVWGKVCIVDYSHHL